MDFKNYYKSLGVSRRANQEEIKKAYRKKALKFHPDKNTHHSSSQLFILIQEAYQVLSHPTKKAKYDIDYDIMYPISYFEKKEKGAIELLSKYEEAILKSDNNYFINYEYANIINLFFFCTSDASLSLIIDTEDETIVKKYITLLINSTMCGIISTNVEYLGNVKSKLLSIQAYNYEIDTDEVINIDKKLSIALSIKRINSRKPYIILIFSLLMLVFIFIISQRK